MNNIGFTVYKHTVLNPAARAWQYADKEKWVTVAEWPDGTTSTDKHDSKDAALFVQKTLIEEGNAKGKPNTVTVVSPNAAAETSAARTEE
jgi:hypothetical protein